MAQEREVSITVRVMTIRDGTHGISLAMPNKLVGEWTDSGAGSLTVTEEMGVQILSRDGSQRYLLSMPGMPLRVENVSDTEATVVVML
ncbi:MAG: hypothetical protein FJ022_01370 [Chloroflexi bacterium]|nr:hypothetical protein [Chloroflexota bacterium]MBM3174314.1 hypothetical protein [Chloroflexota bacterium]MBM4449445.1 hypothetical protein [Chloroflexota bacterium]